MYPHNVKTRFGIIRHAQTEWNVEKRIQGQQDSPLSEEGRRQAWGWSSVLKQHGWDRILSSDLGRARQTAAIVNRTLKVPISYDARLREQNWGHWTGKTLAEVKRNFSDILAQQVARGWQFCPPGGEDRVSVRKRGCQALEAAGLKWPNMSILVVTHEGLLKCILYQFVADGFQKDHSKMLRPNHLHRLVYDQNELLLDRINAEWLSSLE